MDINFFESSDVPQPKDKIKIERLETKPYPDGWRLRVLIDVTPFQVRPNLEIIVRTFDGQQVATLNVIETMHRHMEFTVHIRGVRSSEGQYVTSVDLFYDDPNAPQDHREEPFTVELKK
jgi:hypothetical protein